MSNDADTQEPERRAGKPEFLTDTRFDQFELPEAVLKGLATAGFTYCTPIQARTLPVALTGRDVAGQAQTGTGKTAAFLVTIFTRLLAQAEEGGDLASAIVIAPTRELANQIYEEAKVLGAETSFRITQVVGGIDYGAQAEQLKQGTDIVICTPGRIIDYFKQGIFKTSGIRIVVIDEADRLLDLGFAKDMRYILRHLPHYEKRQSMLYSATLSYRVMELTYEYMNLPEFIAVTPQEVTVEGVEQTLHHVEKEKKFSLLLGILAREDPQRCMIFVNTKAGVEWVTKKLKGNQWPAEGITGDLPQRKRFKLMEGFKSGRLKILVATDVASRGIHVEDVSHVINYDLPQDAENYIHRIGRTARAGKTGRAISLACETYVYHLEPLEDMLQYKLPVVWPEDDWFLEDKAGVVSVERKPRARKGAKAPERRPQRKPEQNRISRELDKRPSGYFPGTFFGFKPPETPGQEPPAEGQEPPAEGGEPQGPPSAKKRRRPRRRKKRVSPAKTGSAEGTGDSPSS